jgi:peptide/nickel transport system permease protein
MKAYLLWRLASLLPVLLGLSVITFGLMGLVPGDPAEILARQGRDVDPTPAQIEATRRALGLDQPLPVQYARWLGRVLRGDLGTSARTGEPVWAELRDRFPATLELALAGLAVGILIALPVGTLAAVWRGTIVDALSRFLALLGAAVPSFWLGAMLILLFAVRLRWLPAMGRGSLTQIALPAMALGVSASAVLMRLTRASLLETLRQDYVRTARAKGLRESAVVLRHALKPAMLPVITIVGLQFGNLLGGALVIETIFAWPGLGQFMMTSIRARDLPVIQGFTLMMGLVFVGANLAVDVAYRWLDPRIADRA